MKPKANSAEPHLQELFDSARSEQAPPSVEREAAFGLVTALGMSESQGAQLVGEMTRQLTASSASQASATSCQLAGETAAVTGTGAALGTSATSPASAISTAAAASKVAAVGGTVAATGAAGGTTVASGLALGLGVAGFGKPLLIGCLVGGAAFGTVEGVRLMVEQREPDGRVGALSSTSIPVHPAHQQSEAPRSTPKAKIAGSEKETAPEPSLEPRRVATAPVGNGELAERAAKKIQSKRSHRPRRTERNVASGPASLSRPEVIPSRARSVAAFGSPTSGVTATDEARGDDTRRTTRLPEGRKDSPHNANGAGAAAGDSSGALGGVPLAAPFGAEQLRQEVNLVDQIRSALRTGNRALALTLCERHSRTFPTGTLQWEVQVLRQAALRQGG